MEDFASRPIVAYLSPPTFDGGRISRPRALALARDCEGDDLADFGALPATYQYFSREADDDRASADWGYPLSFASGLLYLVVGDCERFQLYILSDDRSLLARDDVETYCGWPVVTQIDGRMTRKTSECDEGGTTIKLAMAWRLTVVRMRTDSGELERVLRGKVYAEAWMGNVEVGREDTVAMDYVAEFGVVGYVGAGGGRSPSSVPGAAEPVGSNGAPDLWMSVFAKGCAGLGGSIGPLLNWHLWQMWRSDAAASVDDSGEYVGLEAANVVHALYLLKNSPVFDGCKEWIEGVCESCPIECQDVGPPLDPKDDDVPEVIASP